MKYDAIIILGKGVSAKGMIPKIVQREINAAIQLSKKQHVSIIFSGKHSGLIEQPGKYTEAAGMRRYALSQGVSRSRLFVEEQSQDTIGNALFSKAIIDAHHWQHLLIFVPNLIWLECNIFLVHYIQLKIIDYHIKLLNAICHGDTVYIFGTMNGQRYVLLTGSSVSHDQLHPYHNKIGYDVSIFCTNITGYNNGWSNTSNRLYTEDYCNFT